jgi:hypothetical protein
LGRKASGKAAVKCFGLLNGTAFYIQPAQGFVPGIFGFLAGNFKFIIG